MATPYRAIPLAPCCWSIRASLRSPLVFAAGACRRALTSTAAGARRLRLRGSLATRCLLPLAGLVVLCACCRGACYRSACCRWLAWSFSVCSLSALRVLRIAVQRRNFYFVSAGCSLVSRGVPVSASGRGGSRSLRSPATPVAAAAPAGVPPFFKGGFRNAVPLRFRSAAALVPAAAGRLGQARFARSVGGLLRSAAGRLGQARFARLAAPVGRRDCGSLRSPHWRLATLAACGG